MLYDIEKSGERIRQLRRRNGYTQEKLAALLNIDRSFYSRIESGKNGCSVDLLIQLSDLFGVSLDYIILGKHSTGPLGNTEKQLLRESAEQLISYLEQFKDIL